MPSPRKRDVVIANRILAQENVLDAYGPCEHPSSSRPEQVFPFEIIEPALVEESDIIEYNLDGTPADGDKRSPYLERFIHGGIYEKRPE